MPTYLYKAKHGPDKTVEGSVEAESQAAAVARVDALGYSPVWVREKESQGTGRVRRLILHRVRPRDVTLFTAQLASLTRSAVPILRALRTIENQTENPRLARIIGELGASTRDGRMLSESLVAYPRLFSQLYVNMVRAGEMSGALDVVLTRLTEAREKEEDTRRRVQAALAYPVLIVCAGIATVFALFAFFLPRVLGLFDSYTALPLPTRILVSVSTFFSQRWYWLLIGMGLLLAILNRLASLEKGRVFFDRIKLHAPLLSRFLIQADIARFARTLALLVETGIPIDRALDLSGDTLRNAILREEVAVARDRTVRQGVPLSDGLQSSRHFPLLVSNLVAVGEEGGRLPEALNEVAQFYEKEVEQQARIATSLIEPLLILLVGAVVGFIVAAMLLPIFELGTGLQ